MKKLIILIVLFTLCLFTSKAQNPREPNTIYLILQPADNGIGIRYDRMIKSSYYGIYGALTYGDLKLENGLVIKNHYKLVSGVILYGDPLFRIFHPYFGIGVSYNTYYGLFNIPPEQPETEMDQWSFELSLNTKISNKVNVGVRYDPLMNISSLDVGFSF
jgi:hypothetical protein